MQELSAENLREYLAAAGKLRPDQPAKITWLSGGVSNVVFLIEPDGAAPFVLKQSRAQLRTRADWFSRLDRIFREVDGQRALAAMLPVGAVPNVVFEDRENYCYAMSAVRADHAVWKQQLLLGRVDREVFTAAGHLLGQIHARSATQDSLPKTFADTTVFFELRGDPFYRRIADVHPLIRDSIGALLAEMAAHPLCLVHADYSPKNILVHPEGITLVDHETVHWGDPAFDLGFLFSHLCLKALALPKLRTGIIAGIDTAWEAYRAELTDGPISRDALAQRAVGHLAACLLSRIDGKSGVDYLTEESHRVFIRQISINWLTTPPNNLTMAFTELRNRMNSGL